MKDDVEAAVVSAKKVKAIESERDAVLYTGPMVRGADLDFMNFIAENKSNDALTLVLCTRGGSPDAAYKIGRYLQHRYSDVAVLVPGLCKSAGTLLAIAAKEVVFAPFGELGPLDVQMASPDKLTAFNSGLNMTETFLALEERSRETFHKLVEEILHASNGIVSFPTACRAATDLVSALYGPISEKIDPEEVGSRARAMRIGEYYGQRLDVTFRNLRGDALHRLSHVYPSHGFVIDMDEARVLFKKVREATPEEKELIELAGVNARLPAPEPHFETLPPIFMELSGSAPYNPDTEYESNDQHDQKTEKSA